MDNEYPLTQFHEYSGQPDVLTSSPARCAGDSAADGFSLSAEEREEDASGETVWEVSEDTAAGALSLPDEGTDDSVSSGKDV